MFGYFSREARENRRYWREERDRAEGRAGRSSVPGALRIPGADGYHYADDHPWTQEQQNKVTDIFWSIVAAAGGPVPDRYRTKGKQTGRT